MGSLGSERNAKELIITQVSFGGFDENTSAKQLTDFLEYEAGTIWRCRLKRSWTPPVSYPDFSKDASSVKRKEDYEKVCPHAFVHFAVPDAARRAVNAVGKCELILNGHPLKANWGIDSSFRVNRRRTIDPIKFSDVRLEVGHLVSRDEFWTSWKGPTSGVDFLIDPFDGCCRILFTKETAFAFKGTSLMAVIKCDFKLEFSVRDIKEVNLYKDRAPFVMLLHLTSSPLLSYRTADDDIYTSVPFNLLDDEDPWMRTIDFTTVGAIGRCNYYSISFSPRFGAKLEKAMAYMRERRIIEHCPKRPLAVRNEPGFGTPMRDHFLCLPHVDGISFETMFMLNAVLHKGIVNQHQLSEEFFGLLRSQSDSVNLTSLRHIYSYKNSILNAHKRLKLVQDWLIRNPKLVKSSKIGDDHVEVRRLVITPTKAYCLPPEVELSNRVLRKYKNVADRFLRVTFRDEGMQQLKGNVIKCYAAPIMKDITMNNFPQNTTLYKRLRSILTDGFHLCGRKYLFLAFTSNQLRDQSAWFFAEDVKTKVVSIRSWMGKFSSLNVAKCAARMGQCFSSTYATVDVPSAELNKELPDIERNGYVFSDGIGKLTPDLAMEVAEKLQLTHNPPCAYQIRYAGCKGVIACWPGDSDGIRLSLRPSMNKFESDHTMVEVCSWSRYQPGFLNRQIVTLLSCLCVPDDVFWRMQETMISKLNQMLEDTNVAFEVLTTSCADQGNTAAMMLSAGFKPQSEPHLKGMLSCIRSSQLGDLLEKARIFVPLGRWLMGCLDEVGILEQGQCFIQTSVPSLESCFHKHGSRFLETKKNKQVITGTVVIAKNPCLHPGDVRILEAVDIPELHHLFDCLVFPQKGERPHANEASGSDLDGDLYFVTWEGNLIPPEKRSWIPMDYTPAEVKKLPRQVSPQDIIDFFSKNLVNENLGKICNAHVVHADMSPQGALDEKCLQLAELAAHAVDFPKTGKIVTMPHALRPKLYPDFMRKDDFQSYKSEKILGKLYRRIVDASNEETVSPELTCRLEDLPYDTDLEILGAADFTAEAWQCKCSYDGQLNALLGQYMVNSEGEVVTGHIWSMSKYTSRKRGELKERLNSAYHALQREFRRVFESLGPDSAAFTDEEKNSLYERKASAWYQVTYHPRWVKKLIEMREPDGEGVPVLLSFAWITIDYIVRIKVRGRDMTKMNGGNPIDSLANYLSERL
ncbi:RNA-dependent RNA polymerase 6 [Acorus gramineus]|uniref:RNA-dependent RNA polymerase n=1 Tax=Acorus gramineus TaxID=55184 RepID=A0AAV9BHI6_ACOGR|nr:RNA-dependent RNA polymerase 6 [Acorus gramineus]